MQVATAALAGDSASANEQTAITIALRVPTLANSCGPAAAGRSERGDQLVGGQCSCASGR